MKYKKYKIENLDQKVLYLRDSGSNYKQISYIMKIPPYKVSEICKKTHKKFMPKYKINLKSNTDKEYQVIIERQEKLRERYSVLVIGPKNKSPVIATELAVKSWRELYT